MLQTQQTVNPILKKQSTNPRVSRSQSPSSPSKWQIKTAALYSPRRTVKKAAALPCIHAAAGHGKESGSFNWETFGRPMLRTPWKCRANDIKEKKAKLFHPTQLSSDPFLQVSPGPVCVFFCTQNMLVWEFDPNRTDYTKPNQKNWFLSLNPVQFGRLKNWLQVDSSVSICFKKKIIHILIKILDQTNQILTWYNRTN